MVKAGVEGATNRVPRHFGLVVGDWEVHRPGYGAGVAADLVAVAVQQRAPGDRIVEVSAGDIPQIGVLGDDAQQFGGAAADEYRRPGLLDRLWGVPRTHEAGKGAGGKQRGG